MRGSCAQLARLPLWSPLGSGCVLAVTQIEVSHMGCAACRLLQDQEHSARDQGDQSKATDARVKLKRHQKQAHPESASE